MFLGKRTKFRNLISISHLLLLKMTVGYRFNNFIAILVGSREKIPETGLQILKM